MSSPGLRKLVGEAASILIIAPWSVTDNDRRQRAKQYWPPTLYVGGPVITFTYGRQSARVKKD